MEESNVKNLPARQGEKEMVYQMDNGDEMRLTISTVRKFLVQGRSELVSDKEVLYFMHECKARKLNPFLRQCWLIKYSANENAQIVEAIHHKRNKAVKAPTCQGWEKGIIIKTENGEIKRTKGLLLPGEELIGGWFKATPKDWTVPYELEINLDGFIKKKKDGNITAFWKKEKQPSQIMKVAESQGLSAVWGDTVGTTYMPEEFPPDAAPIDMQAGDNGSYEQPLDTTAFNKFASKNIDYPGDETLDRFIKETSDANGITIDQLKVAASESKETFNDFWKGFAAWMDAKAEKKDEGSQGGNDLTPEILQLIQDAVSEDSEAWNQAVAQEGEVTSEDQFDKVIIVYQEIVESRK